MNEINIRRLSILDGIEIKSATFINKTFPLHFHQNWSLAYIQLGNENISFNHTDIMLNKGALILIPPYSLHKNWGSKNSAWTYKAIYINNDVIVDVVKKINADYSYLASMPYFVTYCYDKFDISEESVFKVLESLFLDALNNDSPVLTQKADCESFNDLLNYISTNYNKPITLDTLEQEFKINKYNLQKSFKKKLGLTPWEYQTAIRIENSKQLFYSHISLVEIALESGFYDQSHFTHSFKKYVGVTPGDYKKGVNILQDQQCIMG